MKLHRVLDAIITALLLAIAAVAIGLAVAAIDLFVAYAHMVAQ